MALKKAPIGIQIGTIFLVCLLFAGMLSEQLVRKSETRYLERRYSEQANRSLTWLSMSILDAIIIKDIPVLETTAEQLVVDDDEIARLNIYDNEDELLVSRGTTAGVRKVGGLTRKFTKEISYEGEKFGSLELTLDVSRGYAEIEEHVQRIRVLSVVPMGALAILILVGIHVLVTRPLSRLKRRIVSPDSANVGAPAYFSSLELELLDEAVTERVSVEKELRAARENLEHRVAERTLELKTVADRMAAIVDGAQDLIISIDKSGCITEFNPSAVATLGWEREAVMGRDFLRLLVPSRFEELRVRGMQSLLEVNSTKDGNKVIELMVQKADGRELLMEVSLTKVEVLGEGTYTAILRDVSTRKEIERQLLQSQKLESVGQLAAGIAHEINTPIQYIRDNALFLKDECGNVTELVKSFSAALRHCVTNGFDESRLCELQMKEQALDLPFLLEEIPAAITQTIEGAEIVARIVRSLKEFSHPGKAEMSSVDINAGLESTMTVSRNEWKYVADLEMDLEDNLPTVMGFVGDLNQVFLNLIVNAAQSIEEKIKGSGVSKGKIEVKTRSVGSDVVIEIRDTGMGIPQEIQEKVFDPFFTTKEVGVGTGQGLTMAYNTIVEKHRGKISFKTEPGEGATFTIVLPAAGSCSDGLAADELETLR